MAIREALYLINHISGEVLIEADCKIAASEILQNKDCSYREIDPFVADIKAFLHVNPRISFHCISRTA
jgi:hypothetical protein